MIKGWLLGGEDMVRRMAGAPAEIQNALQTSVSRMALRLLARVKADKLSGQVLKVRTGRLRRSINQRVVREGQGVYGYVGTNVDYGAVHEYGFQGTVSVRAHIRKLSSRDMVGFIGGKETSKRTSIKRTKTASGVQFVGAHTRNVKLPEKSFLRSALREMQPEIERAMREAVQAAARRATK